MIQIRHIWAPSIALTHTKHHTKPPIGVRAALAFGWEAAILSAATITYSTFPDHVASQPEGESRCLQQPPLW